MSYKERGEIMVDTTISVYRLGEEELEKLAHQFETTVVDLGGGTKVVRAKVPHTEVSLRYFN
jgi:hypothetical protein